MSHSVGVEYLSTGFKMAALHQAVTKAHITPPQAPSFVLFFYFKKVSVPQIATVPNQITRTKNYTNFYNTQCLTYKTFHESYKDE